MQKKIRYFLRNTACDGQIDIRKVPLPFGAKLDRSNAIEVYEYCGTALVVLRALDEEQCTTCATYIYM